MLKSWLAARQAELRVSGWPGGWLLGDGAAVADRQQGRWGPCYAHGLTEPCLAVCLAGAGDEQGGGL